jgi:hypothetical protein
VCVVSGRGVVVSKRVPSSPCMRGLALVSLCQWHERESYSNGAGEGVEGAVGTCTVPQRESNLYTSSLLCPTPQLRVSIYC